MKIQEYAKAVVGAIIAALGALGTALASDHNGHVDVHASEWVAIAVAFFVAFGGVYETKNRQHRRPGHGHQ
jgi:hypothetical protein